MKLTTLSLAVIVFTALNGCNQEKKAKKEIKETAHTSQYYISHPEIRKKRVKECEAMEAMTEVTATDCSNAQRVESMGKLWSY